MNKSKYEKPVARNLDAVQPVQGSCKSGDIEYAVDDECVSGGAAFPPCTVGTVVLYGLFCSTGGDAAQSCWTGTSAG